jgi:hypothetical protein
MTDFRNTPDFGALLAELLAGQARTAAAILDVREMLERSLGSLNRAPLKTSATPQPDEQLAPEWTRDPRWQAIARRALELRHEIGKADHPSVGFVGNLVEKFSHQPRLSEKQGRWLASIAAQLGIEPRE